MAKTTYSQEELERQLAESRREFWAADATINNLELKLADMEAQLANKENKCAALLDELERKQQYIKSRDQENEDIALTVGKLRVELEAADNNLIDSECHVAELEEALRDKQALLEEAEMRIAELEAREIKPAKGEVLVVVSGFTGCGKSAIAGEIEIAMKAIGVPVKWTNGDAEKRMTGADWLTAIEMYKPTVRIVEVNVPRAAGIRIKGE